MTPLEKKIDHNEIQMFPFLVVFQACSNRSHSISIFVLFDQSIEECSFFCLWISIQTKVNNVRLIQNVSRSIWMNLVRDQFPMNYSLKLNQCLINILSKVNHRHHQWIIIICNCQIIIKRKRISAIDWTRIVGLDGFLSEKKRSMRKRKNPKWKLSKKQHRTSTVFLFHQCKTIPMIRNLSLLRQYRQWQLQLSLSLYHISVVHSHPLWLHQMYLAVILHNHQIVTIPFFDKTFVLISQIVAHLSQIQRQLQIDSPNLTNKSIPQQLQSLAQMVHLITWTNMIDRWFSRQMIMKRSWLHWISMHWHKNNKLLKIVHYTRWWFSEFFPRKFKNPF